MRITATVTARVWEPESTSPRLSPIRIESGSDDLNRINLRIDSTVYVIEARELREAIRRCDLSGTGALGSTG